MTERNDARWIVLKFGGTSVSNLSNWTNIAAVTRKRLAEGANVLIVHSAVSGITDRLERLLAPRCRASTRPRSSAIVARHQQLCDELGVGRSAQLDGYFTELRADRAGHPPDARALRPHARRGDVHWRADGHRDRLALPGEAGHRREVVGCARGTARRSTRHIPRRRATTFRPPATSRPMPRCRIASPALSPVVITQGFIASDARGDTVLLGRGGSDTSGAYFAAKLSARRLEIWTDVPGMFSANPRTHALGAAAARTALRRGPGNRQLAAPRCCTRAACMPVRVHRIPLFVYATQMPDLEGTHITAVTADSSAKVKAVCVKKGITLVSMESPGMWHEVGFLADAFQVFKRHGTVGGPGLHVRDQRHRVAGSAGQHAWMPAAMQRLLAELSELCRADDHRALRLGEPRGSQYPRHPA